ncbi:MAG: response regulator [Bdellovibrionales bacterium]
MKNKNDFSNLKALTVDDHALARRIVTNALESLQVGIIDEAPDPLQGQTMIEQAQRIGKPYDLVFLDWSMPSLEGIDILRHFQDKPEHANTSFIMFTAASEKGEMLQAVRAGVIAFIPKPASQETIIQKIKEVVALRENKK